LTRRAAGDGDGFGIARQRALDHYQQVQPDERHWCSAELGEIEA
jgi:hypothetical protein